MSEKATNQNHHRHIEHWFRRGLGKNVLTVETESLSYYLERLFGYHLLQIGGPMLPSLVMASPIAQKIYLHPEYSSHDYDASIIADFIDLPFQMNSLDLVLLPHMLELQPTSGLIRILNETYNILIPEGHIIITGFNPVSLFGLKRLWSRNKGYPWSSDFRRIAVICKLLRSVGFKIIDYKTLFFRPPITHVTGRKHLLFMEALGSMVWPFAGGVYIIVAKKSLLGMTPIKVPVKKRAEIAVSVTCPKPTSRVWNEKS